MNTDFSGKRILVVDDEASVFELLKSSLEGAGYEVEIAIDGREGLRKALDLDIDLVLLDIMLPYLDGFELCKRIREKSNVPIIFVTAHTDEVDKVLGLELGADDYITKPFSVRELLARVKANLRRVSSGNIIDGNQMPIIHKFGEFMIDFSRCEVKKNGELLELSSKEFGVLKYLAEREDKVYTREQLLEAVWGYEYFGDTRTVDVTIRRLREKLEDDSANPKYILTRRGMGYYFHIPE